MNIFNVRRRIGDLETNPKNGEQVTIVIIASDETVEEALVHAERAGLDLTREVVCIKRFTITRAELNQT